MRKFTKREKAMLLILCTLIIGALYYFLVLTPMQARASAANTRMLAAQDTIAIEQVRATKYMAMKKELEVMKESGQQLGSQIPDYNNMSNVIVQLDGIFATTPEYEIGFPNILIESRLITRPVNVSFTATNYEAAKSILSALSKTLYRSIMTEVTMEYNPIEGIAPSVNLSEVKVTASINFYEHNTIPKPAAEETTVAP